MSNPYFNADGNPGTRSSVSSAVIRAEFTALAAAFDKLPPLTANKAVVVNAGGTALTVTAGSFSLAADFTLSGGAVTFGGSFTTTFAATANVTLTLPSVDTTLIGSATTATLTHKTFDTAGTGNVFKINGTTVTDVTGTGAAVLATSPTIATPTLTNPVVGTQSVGDNSTKAASTAYADGVMPVGTVVSYIGSTAPNAQWLLCFGQAVSRATYAALNAIMSADSYPYGSGNGSTTFNLPDLRGRVVAGKDDMGGSAASRLTNATISPNATTLGASGGLQTGSSTATVSGVVTVSSGAVGVSGTVNSNSGSASSGGGSGFNYTVSGDTLSGTTNVITSNGGNTLSGTTGTFSIVQPTIILNYIIKVL